MSITSPQTQIDLASTSPADLPLDRLPSLELSKNQLKKAQQIAKKRARSYESINGGSIYGRQSSVSAHKIGVIGELVVAELYGGEIDRAQYRAGDGGFDLDWVGGHTVDIKCSRTQAMDRPDLLVPPKPEPTADLFILVHWFAEHRARVIGMATRSNVLRREPKRHPGSNLNHVVPAAGLLLPPAPRGSRGFKK